MLTISKLLIIFADIMSVLLVLIIPEEYRGNVCILLSDLIVLLVVIQQIKKKIPDIILFFFNITYFVFILGGGTFTMFGGEALTNFTDASYVGTTTACIIAFVSILIINSVYYLSINHCTNKKVETSVFGTPTLLQKQIVVVIFILSFMCKFAMAWETMMYSQLFGYVSLYTRDSTNLPSIIGYVGSLFYFSFLLFLSSNFSKKVTYLGLFSVAIIEAIVLNSGDRGEAVCGIIIMAIYVINRVKKEPQFLVHKKMVIFIIVIAVPLGIYLLQAIKYLRVGESYSSAFSDGLSDFFISQGVSLNIMAHGVDLQDSITQLAGDNFIWGQLKGYLEQNVISRTIFGITPIRGSTVEAAMSGTSYGSAMAYLRFRSTYLQGVGCGTCFLAELFHDGKWIGVIIGSVIIPFLFKKMMNYHNLSWIKNALCLNCMRVLLMLPRGAYFKWVTEVFSFQNLLLLALLLVFSANTKIRICIKNFVH